MGLTLQHSFFSEIQSSESSRFDFSVMHRVGQTHTLYNIYPVSSSLYSAKNKPL